MSLDINDIAISAINSLGFSGSRYVTSSWNTSSNTAYVNIENTYFRGYYFNDLRVTISFDNNGYLDQYSMSGYRSGSRFSESGLHNLSYSQRNSVEAAYDQIEAREQAEEQRIIAAAEAQKAFEAAEALITQEKNVLRDSFDADYYIAKYSVFDGVYGNNNDFEAVLDHYVRWGKAAGRSGVNEAEALIAQEKNVLRDSFDADYYIAKYSVFDGVYGNNNDFEAVLDHYVRWGKAAGRHAINSSPTNIIVSSTSVKEKEAGLTVGTLSVTDSTDSSHTLTLSGTDANYFEILNEELKLKNDVVANYDVKKSYNLSVTGIDPGNLSYTKSFVIDVIQMSKEFQVNTYTLGDQFTPRISALNNGGFVVTWASHDQDGSGMGIYGQRYDSSGAKNGSEFQVNTFTSGHQLSQRVTSLSDGGFVIVWESFNQDGDNFGAYGQLYNNSGDTVGSEFQIDSYTSGGQTVPWVTALSDGGFIVSWNSSESTTILTDEGARVRYGSEYFTGYDATQDLERAGSYVKRFDKNAYAIGNEIKIPGLIQTTLLDGSFVSINNNSVGQLYSRNFTEIGDEFLISIADYNESYGAVFSLRDGGFLVTWDSGGYYHDGRDGSRYGVFAQRFDENGLRVSSDFQVNTYFSNRQLGASSASLSNSGFVIVWNSENQDGSDFGIFSQLYDSNGATVGAEFQVNTYTSNIQSEPSVTALNDGGFVIVWSSENQDGSDFGIFGQRYNSDGKAVDLETQAGTATNDTFNGSLTGGLINGGAGVDLVSYSLLNKNISFSLNSNDQLVIKNSTEQSDILISMERISLTDTSYALDTDGNAGTAAKVIISAFGTENLSSYMSSILSVVDGGKTIASLSDYVIELGLIDTVIGSSSSGPFVTHVFENVVGRLPNIVEQAIYTDYLDNGTYTKSSLLALAANTTLTANLLTENTIDLIGVAGSADGEILALQYDLGLG